jgi:hypothetical protein
MPDAVAEAVAHEIVAQTWRHARRFHQITRTLAYRYAA